MNIKKRIGDFIFNNSYIEERFIKYNKKYAKKFKQVDVLTFDKIYHEELVFPVFDIPAVSIIIPVYNQFAYTFACLYSILKNTDGVEYEIIIADDCSTDETVGLSSITKNITIIRNKNNLGFLKNINHAVKSAKGKYLLLLNNDTKMINKNWLSVLVDTLEKDKTVGAVGGKNLFEPGILQSAGGKITFDGRSILIGKKCKPDAAEYNREREVDFVPGCCFLVKKSDWDKLGGFDERFVPAYYEETDLCFRLKYELGYKIMYQPKSEMIHFHKITYSREMAQLMQINRKKFVDKWKAVLSSSKFDK